MTFSQLAKKRFANRNFQPTPVEPKKLSTILEAGRIAPTAANFQPQRLLLIESEEGRRKLSKAVEFYNAPTAIVVCYDKGCVWKRDFDGKDTGDIDTSIITTHMMMAAVEQGLDTLWMTWYNPEVLKEELEIPENLEPVSILAIGYSGGEPADSERHSTLRKPLSETVFRESFY